MEHGAVIVERRSQPLPDPVSRPLPSGLVHLRAIYEPLRRLEADLSRIDAWGAQLAAVLIAGGRLLACGNGGSAAEVQHLTSELVGRYRDERHAFSALALHAESSSLTAIANDYGAEHAFARQAQAHGRPGDVLVAISTSGKSRNVLNAVRAAREAGMSAWALTGPHPNPLSRLADDAICIESPATATIQEAHLVVIHLLCAAVEIAAGVSTAHPLIREVQ
jgi:D-sedoheptulose 7-phosphate isomerase